MGRNTQRARRARFTARNFDDRAPPGLRPEGAFLASAARARAFRAFHIVKCRPAMKLIGAPARRPRMLVSLDMGARFLAFDLGAESGRAISGHLRSGVLDLREVCRFSNEPVREHGSLYWDVLRLWLHMQ